MHSPSKTERLWFSHLLESQMLPKPMDKPLLEVDKAKKKRIHELLARSEVLDHFLQAKFPNLKRVSRMHLFSCLGMCVLRGIIVWFGRRRVDVTCT